VLDSEVEPARVLVVDRQPLLRRGVVAVLNAESDLQVVGDTGDIDTAVYLAGIGAPHVVLLGLSIAGGVVAACERLRGQSAEIRVVVLADNERDGGLAAAVRAGVRGYVIRDVEPVELLEALRMVAAGRSLLSPAVVSRMLDEFAQVVRRSVAISDGAMALSSRELEVLHLVADGLNNRAVAEKLFISGNTVKNPVRSIHEKLQVHSRMEAVVRARRDGLLT
jgi:DNA-binding NarL/FixJ family response regulator